ncbi:hypothetical protein K502DRAFT_353573 [Neoconidiobolus thromboides FSU 785]|nr:hypothetical protein K502DRAFT_353573 [Neoconidiobolus thromboides FSU 785]
MSFLTQIEACANFKKEEIEFNLVYQNNNVGIVSKEVAAELKNYNSELSQQNEKQLFNFQQDKITITRDYYDFDTLTRAFEKLFLQWRKEEKFMVLNGWRNELYPIYYKKVEHNDSVACVIERVGSFLLGINTFGVHINGYTFNENKMYIWIAKRSKTKPTWPNMLDNMCAGGISYGDSVYSTLLKECLEEGNIPNEITKNVINNDNNKSKSAGVVSYITKNEFGISSETQYIYDLELPWGYKPTPNDGEVGQFYCWEVDKVLEALKNNEFKPNCGLIMIDFFIRHGILTADSEPNLSIIQALCHQHL